MFLKLQLVCYIPPNLLVFSELDNLYIMID